MGSLKNKSAEGFGKIKVRANCTFEINNAITDMETSNEVEIDMDRGLEKAEP